MNQAHKRDFLNLFYILHLKRLNITPQDYVRRLTGYLGKDPMEADWRLIHEAQREIGKQEGTIK